MRLLRLASWVSLRHLRDQSGRTLVSILGVALGVSMFVAIRLASNSAIDAFNESVQSIAGKANLQVSGRAEGVDERLFAPIRSVPGVRSAWPVIETLASVPDRPGQSLLVAGMDFFTDPRIADIAEPGQEVSREQLLGFLVDPSAIAVTRSCAERNGWKVGSRIRLSHGARTEEFAVSFLLPDRGIARAYGGDVAILDIAAAQERFGRLGRLDRIDLIVAPGAAGDRARREIAALAPSADVQTPAAQGERFESMISSFRLNMLALALVALFVGAFLIFNSVSLSVVQRRREIGIARSVGVSRSQIVLLFLGEALLYGIFGAVVGLALGALLSTVAIRSVSGTVSDLYSTVRASRVALDASTMVYGFLLGLAAALLSGLAPALEAASTRPGLASREGSIMQRRRARLLWLGVSALGLAALGALAARLSLDLRNGLVGFASAGLLLLASALAAPLITLLLARLAAWPARRLGGVEGEISARWVSQSLERTAVVIAALASAVTMLIALNMMVGSFRRTVEVWMQQTVQADIFVEPASRTVTGAYSELPPEVPRIMASLPGVRAVQTLRRNTATFEGRPVEIFAFSLATQRDYSALVFVKGRPRDMLQRALDRGHILVSETFAERFGYGEGDSITLTTPTGPHQLTIGGVFYDYTTEAGLIVFDLQHYAKLWNDDAINSAAIYLQDDRDEQAVRIELQKRASPSYHLTISPNRALKRHVLVIFDRAFAITNALKVVAVAIAVLGVVTTMAALILQRQREIGILRSVGASRAQVAKMAVIESGLIGTFGTLIGFLWGPAVAWVLIRVINKLFFGWTIIPTLEARWFLEAGAWVIAASFLAGFIPARFASRTDPAEALHGF